MNNVHITPMKAMKLKGSINPESYFSEIKFDGVRALVNNTEEGTRIYNADGELITYRYPELIINDFNGEITTDGEIIIGYGSKLDFQRLQERMNLMDKIRIGFLAKKEPVTYVAFDILSYLEEDITGRPLSERKSLLATAMHTTHVLSNQRYSINSYVDYSSISESTIKTLMNRNYEGLMLKRKDSRYEAGKRSRYWLKRKFLQDVDAVILGFTTGEGARSRDDMFGSLVLGAYKNGTLREIGSVGTGFTEAQIRAIKQALIVDHTEDEVTYVEPTVVVRIECLDITEGGNLRQPSFKGIRYDKRPHECVIGVDVVREAEVK